MIGESFRPTTVQKSGPVAGQSTLVLVCGGASSRWRGLAGHDGSYDISRFQPCRE